MSRTGRNDVRGPSSALTSFLREHGITARNTFGYRRETAAENEAGPSNAQAEPPNEDEDMEVTRTPRRSNSGYASDNLDDSGDQGDSPPKKKRKLTKAAAAKLKEKEAAAQKKKKKTEASDDEDEDDEEDPYKAPSKGVLNGITGDTPPIGTFQNCAECGKKFTVSKYTLAADPGPGFLCHVCAKSSGIDPFKKKAEPRKKKTEKRVVQNFEEVEPVKSLTAMCIEKIGESIDRIEELGDIGAANMDQICKIISKNRSITATNVRLLYDATNKSLSIYDSTNIKSPEYATMSALNPNLERLTLHLCGQMESVVLQDWSRSFKNLTRLELLGPFLVREEAWITFLRAKGPQLSGFLITNTPRFNSKCLDVLVESAVNLKELRLSEFNKIEDTWLEGIAQLSKLTSLELSYPLSPAPSLSSKAIIDLMEEIGPNLTRLDLSGNEGLEDAVLQDGIAPNAKSLQSLSLSLLPLLTDEGVAAFFGSLPKAARLANLDLSRCHNLASLSLAALLKHSGPTLVNLNINGWKEVGDDALSQITEFSPHLVELDVGWCRNVNDLVMGHLMKPKTGKTELKTILCFGCNRITRNCPKRPGVNIMGVESDVRR